MEREIPSGVYPPRGKRRLNPVLWSLVVLIIASAAVIGSIPFSRGLSPLLLSLTFLAVVAIGAIIFFTVDGYLVEKEMLKRLVAERSRLERLRASFKE
jgi:hypothetical protein